MNVIALVILALLAAIPLYVRLAPSDPAAWHVDPLTAEDPGRRGVLWLPGPDAPSWDLPPGDLLADFDRVAMAAPRVTRLAGSVAEGHVTYVARSKWLRFPDYISVRAVPFGQGSQLAILSRARFGSGDLGVNRDRLKGWFSRLDTARAHPA